MFITIFIKAVDVYLKINGNCFLRPYAKTARIFINKTSVFNITYRSISNRMHALCWGINANMIIKIV